MKCPTSLAALALVGLIFAGCSKHSPEASGARPNPNVKDFGVVEVTNGVQSRYEMGGGRVCFLTPTLQKDGSLLLSMTVEESGKVLSRPRVVTQSGMAFQISVGDIGIGMTPVIKK